MTSPHEHVIDCLLWWNQNGYDFNYSSTDPNKLLKFFLLFNMQQAHTCYVLHCERNLIHSSLAMIVFPTFFPFLLTSPIFPKIESHYKCTSNILFSFFLESLETLGIVNKILHNICFANACIQLLMIMENPIFRMMQLPCV